MTWLLNLQQHKIHTLCSETNVHLQKYFQAPQLVSPSWIITDSSLVHA